MPSARAWANGQGRPSTRGAGWVKRWLVTSIQVAPVNALRPLVISNTMVARE